MKKDTDILSAFNAKLLSSDLSVKDAKALGYVTIENPNALEDHFFKVPAFKIPYHDPSGKATGFYRIRYLADTRKGILKSSVAKARRYDQPAQDLPQLYFPPLLPAKKTWAQLLDNPEIPLIFTEGELKAACATKHGMPTIALGGVWNFKSKKSGLFRLPSLSAMKLKGRTVFIIFDSDSATNPQVLHAQYKFAEELFHCGATPVIVNIPKVEGKKHGIDDFIVEFGVKAFKELLSDEHNHSEFSFVREMLRLNSQIALVVKPVSILHFETGQLLDRGAAQMVYANARMMDQVIVPAKKDEDEDTIKYKEVATFDKWLQWEQRGEVYAPVYEPGKEKFVWEDEKRFYNTWKGWGCEPQKGDVSLWKWLLDCIFRNAEPSHRRWFEQWCAYPIQHAGVKMFTCPILFGQMKGTGKSLLGLSLASIYGENAAEITDAQLEDERNVFAAEKQFILANEVTGSDKRTMVGRLRNLITQHTVVINKKYQPDYTVRDTINYFFTSNHIDAVYMEDDERRFFVHEVIGPRLLDADARKVIAYDAWLKSGECAKALFHHLLNVDLTGFDPTAPAPDTAAKAKMVEASRSEIENWAAKLKEDPDTCLRSGAAIVPFSLFRSKELIDLFAGADGKKPYEKTLTNALRKAGFEKAAHGESCPTKDGKINLWAVRDAQDAQRTRLDIGRKYDEERSNQTPKKFAKGGKSGKKAKS